MPRRGQPPKRAVETSFREGPRLVSLALLLPYQGVDHAGGDLLLQHYRVLAEHCSSLDVFAVDFNSNKAAAEINCDVEASSFCATVIDLPRWRTSLPGKFIARMCEWALPLFPDIGLYAAYSSSKDLHERIRTADIVELQWFEYFRLARLVKRINPAAAVVGYVHDVPYQKFERRLARWPTPARQIYLAYVAFLERLVLRAVDTVTVLSEKDAVLLARRSTRIKPVILHPPLDVGRTAGRAESSANNTAIGLTNQSFGFIGALHRPENDDACRWLLSEIWPRVIMSCPEAHLYLVGSKPTEALSKSAVQLGDSVTVTGYVDDLDAFYDRFDTVVVPLRYGAGVKFKTISAILARKNVISTPVGIEGTLPAEYFYCVSESASTLAAAMINLANAPALGADVARRAKDAVGSVYSLQNYTRTVVSAYGVRDPRTCG